MAAAVRRGDDCLRVHAIEMGDDAGCGRALAIAACFAQITRSEVSDLAECYRSAGCSEEEAASKSLSAHSRCEVEFEDTETPELRRRSRGILEREAPAAVTPSPDTAATPLIANPAFLFARGMSGDEECYDTRDVDTTQCDFETSNGDVRTVTCTPTTVPKAECKEGLTCSFDNSGTPICMELQTTLDIGGIIIAIIFGVGIVAGIAAITFLCCKDRRDQKRIAAKAEATALARAQTKKKKAQEQRTPLMRDRDPSGGAAPAPGNPFHDGNRP